MAIRVSFRTFAKGVEMECNGILGGAKRYDPPGSKHMFDKLGDPRIIYFP